MLHSRGEQVQIGASLEQQPEANEKNAEDLGA
jgi:hypothetical protein